MKTEELREVLDYEPGTGVFRVKIRLGKLRVKDVLGSKHSGGYREAMVRGKKYYLHRLAWQYVYGEVPPNQVDHINGDRSDNRISNLRLAHQQQNSANMRRRPNNKSGLKGVHLNRYGKWIAMIHFNRKTKYLGTFPSKEDAHAAYIEAATLAFGEYARSE